MNLLDAMRYLTVLEQHRHFGRAASACHITQPALSNALRALEEELGVALVRRSRQYEGLTAEGEVVLAHAHRLLHGVEGLRQELASLAGAPRGVLRLGAVPTAVPVAARFAARLRARHPGIRPVLQSLSSQAIEAGLDSLALDLALGYIERPDVAERGLQVLSQYDERYFLVERGGEALPAASDGGLRLGAPCAWPEVAERALVMLTPEMHNRRIVEAALAEAGAQAHPVLETDSVLALLQAVQDEGAGGAVGELAAVLPGALVDTLRHQPGLVIRPLAGPLVETPIGWMSSGSAPPTRVLEAALAYAVEPAWLAQLRRHTGLLLGED